MGKVSRYVFGDRHGLKLKNRCKHGNYVDGPTFFFNPNWIYPSLPRAGWFPTIELVESQRSEVLSYTSEFAPGRVRWVLLIGAVASAAGARAPLSSIL